MTSPTNLYKAYHRANHTVAKTRQVVMLYDGAIRFLNQAREAMEKNEVERRYKSLTRASEIIVGLQSCLDFEAGNIAAQALFDFYSSLDLRIVQLHRTRELETCQQVIRELKEMREVWYGIDRGQADAAPAAEPAPAMGVQPVTVSA